MISLIINCPFCNQILHALMRRDDCVFNCTICPIEISIEKSRANIIYNNYAFSISQDDKSIFWAKQNSIWKQYKNIFNYIDISNFQSYIDKFNKLKAFY